MGNAPVGECFVPTVDACVSETAATPFPTTSTLTVRSSDIPEGQRRLTTQPPRALQSRGEKKGDFDSEVSVRSPVEQPAAAAFHESYEILGKLGCGTFAQVYAARRHHGHSPDLAAVKASMLKNEGSRDEPGRRAPPSENQFVSTMSLRREAEILRRAARCEYCLDFYGLFVEGGMSYLVMELCDMTICEAMRGISPLTAKDLRALFCQALRAAASIHEAGIVHRDIKPDNFLVQLGPSTGPSTIANDLTLKLCDFGLADIVDKRRPMIRGCSGTAPFMSPEMLNREEYDASTDVWSVGVMMYVLLYGFFPYRPRDPSPKAMKEAIRTGEEPISYQVQIRDESGRTAAATASAVPLLQKVLHRVPGMRITAKQAVSHEWFNKDRPRENEYNYFSVINAARRSGAFDVRNVSQKPQRSRGPGLIDKAMIDAQSLHFPSAGAQICESVPGVKKTFEPSSRRRGSSKESSHSAFSSTSTRYSENMTPKRSNSRGSLTSMLSVAWKMSGRS